MRNQSNTATPYAATPALPATLRRLCRELFGIPMIEASRRRDAFETAYELARERPVLVADLLHHVERSGAASDSLVDLRVGFRAGLRDERTVQQHTRQRADGGVRAVRYHRSTLKEYVRQQAQVGTS